MQPAGIVLQFELLLVALALRHRRRRHHRPPDREWLRVLLDRLRRMSQR
jgi:hypothetical protein